MKEELVRGLYVDLSIRKKRTGLASFSLVIWKLSCIKRRVYKGRYPLYKAEESEKHTAEV